MVANFAKSKIADAAIAVVVSYVLFAGYAAVLHRDPFDLFRAVLFFAFAIVGPFIAVATFWYAIPAIAVFAVLGVLAARKIRNRLARIVAFLALLLVWLVYGIRCFTLVTGGA